MPFPGMASFHHLEGQPLSVRHERQTGKFVGNLPVDKGIFLLNGSLDLLQVFPLLLTPLHG